MRDSPETCSWRSGEGDVKDVIFLVGETSPGPARAIVGSFGRPFRAAEAVARSTKGLVECAVLCDLAGRTAGQGAVRSPRFLKGDRNTSWIGEREKMLIQLNLPTEGGDQYYRLVEMRNVPF